MLRKATVCGWVFAVLLASRAGAVQLEAGTPAGQASSIAVFSADFPDLGRILSRASTHSEHSVERVIGILQSAGLLWVWLMLSTAAFIAVVAVASAIDVRMMDLRAFRPYRFWADVRHGIWMFFRLSVDRRTPNLARALLLIGLLYWLEPVDLIPDSTWLPGLVDDVLIAIIASKLFVYLCPDVVIARHAHAVDTL